MHSSPFKIRRLTLKVVFHGLKKELKLLGPVYERRRPESLIAYSTLPSLIERLTSGATDPSHSDLVCTLLATHQATPHRLWVAILLRTFQPMVEHVYKKLLGADREERLALLLTAFQETVLKVDPHRDPIRIAMYIRQETRRGVFAALGKQRDWEEVGFGVDADLTPDESTEARATAADRVRHMPDLALLQTRTEHGALWDLVQRDIPDKERPRTYHRLRRRREKLIAKLRAVQEAL